MTAKPQISDGAGMRVGVPLARAQRLAARRGTPRRRPRLPALLIGAAFAGLLAAGLLAPAQGPQTASGVDVDVETVAHTALAAPIPAAAGFADLPQLPVVPAARPATVLPCIARVEDGLRTLGGLDRSADAEAAAERSRSLALLVQDTLECGSATFEIEGSLELVGARLADLRVAWDREASHLHLTVIGQVDPAEAQVARAEDGLPITFVVH